MFLNKNLKLSLASFVSSVLILVLLTSRVAGSTSNLDFVFQVLKYQGPLLSLLSYIILLRYWIDTRQKLILDLVALGFNTNLTNEKLIYVCHIALLPALCLVAIFLKQRFNAIDHPMGFAIVTTGLISLVLLLSFFSFSSANTQTAINFLSNFSSFLTVHEKGIKRFCGKNNENLFFNSMIIALAWILSSFLQSSYPFLGIMKNILLLVFFVVVVRWSNATDWILAVPLNRFSDFFAYLVAPYLIIMLPEILLFALLLSSYVAAFF